MRTTNQSDPVALLSQILSLGTPGTIAACPAGPVGDETLWSSIWAAAVPRGLLPAVADRIAPQCFPGAAGASDQQQSTYAEAQLRDHLAGQLARSQRQRLHLIEIVDTMNRAGIEPLLMTCARAIWRQSPRWHFARDLGVLVADQELAEAKRRLAAKGYRQVAALEPSGFKCETIWYRPDLSGWIALRALSSHLLVESLLSGAELLRSSGDAPADGAVARVLPADLSLLHSMLVHCPQRQLRFIGGPPTVALEALYEFAWSITQLSPDEAAAVHQRASLSLELGAILDVWLETARQRLHLSAGLPLAGRIGSGI